jgi:hypothetical protein
VKRGKAAGVTVPPVAERDLTGYVRDLAKLLGSDLDAIARVLR